MVNEIVISKLLPITHRLSVGALREAPDGPRWPPPPSLAAALGNPVLVPRACLPLRGHGKREPSLHLSTAPKRSPVSNMVARMPWQISQSGGPRVAEPSLCIRGRALFRQPQQPTGAVATALQSAGGKKYYKTREEKRREEKRREDKRRETKRSAEKSREEQRRATLHPPSSASKPSPPSHHPSKPNPPNYTRGP